MVNPACAACKHQKKRCGANCELARYFPQEKMEDFLNVYRLFGVNNVMKILKDVNNEDDKEKTVETLIMEAKFRRDNPVYGSFAVKNQLEAEIDACTKELQLVKNQLSFFKKVTEKHKQMKQLEAQLDKCPLSLRSLALEENGSVSQPSAK